MDMRTVGESALVGWRERIGARVAAPVARRTGLDAESVRIGVGLIFLGLSLWYVTGTLMRIMRRS